MKKKFNPTIISTSSALALLLASFPAHADISPAEAWAKLNEFAKIYNYDVSVGSQQESGGTLSLSDVTFSLAEDEMTIRETIPQIDLKQAGDGSVTMTVSPTITGDLTIDSPIDGTTTIPITANLDGFEGRLEIVNDQLTIDYTASVMTISITEYVQKGASVPVVVNIAATDLGANYAIDANFDGAFNSNITLGAIALNGAFSDPKEGSFDVNATYKSLLANSDGTMPKGANMQDPMIFITGGVSFAGMFAHQGGSFDFNFTGPEGNAQGNMTSDSGQVEFGIAADGLTVSGASTNLNSTMSGSTIPLPVVSFASESASYSIKTPIAKSEGVDDFAISTRLNGLTVHDGIWGMVDPSKVLPRDPANLVVDVSGKAALLVDLFDEDAMESMAEPAQIHALKINELRLNVAGADLTGAGAFMFDNNKPSPFGAGPKPTGELDLALTGGNGLIDKLVQLGLLPEDQAMAGRMMLGLFATPGEGPDSLTSKIEVTDEGGILANGQRLQ